MYRPLVGLSGWTAQQEAFFWDAIGQPATFIDRGGGGYLDYLRVIQTIPQTGVQLTPRVESRPLFTFDQAIADYFGKYKWYLLGAGGLLVVLAASKRRRR